MAKVEVTEERKTRLDVLPCVVISYRNFLKFRGLLAADTIAGLEGLDVAHFAEITYSVELPILDGE